MNQTIHIVSNTIPGYTLPNGKCPASRREALLSSSIYRPRTFCVSCKANNNHRRNPDFSRHQRGSSRGRNRNHQERENSENQDESDPLVSKNGSLLSLSSNQRYSATSTPGKREKEIVELFRKVQAQLRERAAIKEEQKIEASQQGQQEERGTVDSLLNLLRKHSIAQNKKSGREEEFNEDEPERSELVEEQSSSFLSSNSVLGSDEVVEPDPLQSSRPASSFRRRSPVPRVKFQPVFLKSEEKKKDDVYKPEQELVTIEEIDDAVNDDDDVEDEIKEETAKEISDLASLKLVELKEMAKSRGIKGYSKMKKSELVELLNVGG